MTIKKRFSITERQEVVEKAARCLRTGAGKLGLDYLLSDRQLSDDVLRDFSLGYIPPYVNHQLRGRIILPLYDPTGNLVAVGSRSVGRSDFLPVYWHESYEKQFYLYGMNKAHQSMRKHKFAIVVEGQFDLLQMASHGIQNVVALCGNKLSQVQISIIQRYCDAIVLVLDTDENKAGQTGAMKALESSKYVLGAQWPSPFPSLSFERESCSDFLSRQVISVSFPENADPDEFIRKHGIDEFKKIVKEKLHELRNKETSKP